jgi:hypothetical protein
LHLTRRQDLLDLELPEPDIALYGAAIPGLDGPANHPGLKTIPQPNNNPDPDSRSNP